jgi:PBP1b-binding outer membrane lipoprotein LpoB
MKNHIALIFAAGTLFLAGCCTTEHATKWEYKVVAAPRVAPIFGGTNAPTIDRTNMASFFQNTFQKQRDSYQDFLNGQGQDGWELIKEEDGTFYFKRAIK